MKNPNQPNNVKITLYDTGRVVVVEGLSEQQQKQLSELLRASGIPYQWHAWLTSKPGLGARVTGYWRRLNAWLAPLLLIMALSATAMAQARTVQPVKLAFVETVDSTQVDKDFAERLRAALGRRGDVVFTARSDYDISAACEAITKNSGRETLGYACAVMTVAPQGSTRRHFRLAILIAPSLEELAEDMARKLDREYFQARGR